MSRKVVCVDLDGTLAPHGSWRGVTHFGDPFPGAKAFLAALIVKYDVLIWTVRVNPKLNGKSNYSTSMLRKLVENWLDANDLPYTAVWDGPVKPICAAFVDDRAVSCRPTDDPFAYTLAMSRVQELAG